MKIYGVIVAGGSSERFGGALPKQYKEICGRPLLSWTIEKFQQATTITGIVVVVAEEYLLYTSENIIDPYGFDKVSKIVIGGSTRQESVYNGLKALPVSTDYVAIHDAARVLITPSDIDNAITLAQEHRAAIVATPETDTLNRTGDNFILATIDRNRVYRAQTPQVFQYDLIFEAHKEFQQVENGNITDDASLVEKKGFKIKIVEPSGYNFKVTDQADFHLAELLLREQIDG